jgi:5-(carboxyamino)imidazole ribonucleotide mutase
MAFAASASDNGFGVIIAAAGKAAHLAGILAAHTILPVIGIPIKSSTLDGLDSLLSTVQMPSGIPVATVAIDGADNAALLAIQIMSGAHPVFRAKMKEYKAELARKVEQKNAKLQELLKEEDL